MIRDLLSKNYDLICLPLTLPDHGSLAISDLVHRERFETRLYLISHTSAPRRIILKLFDGFADFLGPTNGKPVTMWSNADDAWSNVVRGLRSTITLASDLWRREEPVKVAGV